MGNIIFQEISFNNNVLLEEIFLIYKEAFPLNEQQPIAVIKTRLQQSKEIVIAATINDKVVGFGFLYDLKNTDFLLLDYLAIKENQRGQNIGGSLLTYLKQYASKIKKHLLMEVDDPKYGGEERRVAFYQKNGAYWLKDVKYILPALDGDNATEQILMIVPFGAKTTFNGMEIKRLAKILYRELYGIDGKNNDLELVLKSVNNRVLAVDYQKENYF